MTASAFRRAPALWILAAAATVSGCAVSSGMRPEVGTGWCATPATVELGGSGEDPVQVRWVASEVEATRQRSAEWCTVVGPPVVISDPAPALVPTAPPEEIVAVTWNIWVGGGNLEAFLTEEFGFACSERGPSAPYPGPPLVAMLQEVHRRSPDVPLVEQGAPVPWGIHPEVHTHLESDIVRVARRCGLALAYIPSARNGWEAHDGLGEDKGNAILSTLPLTRVTGIDLPFEGGRKVAVAASASVPSPGPGADSLRLDLVSLHLDVASTLVRTLTSGNLTRLRQARGLLTGLEVGGFTGYAGVVGGDFNTWVSRDASLKEAAEEFPDSPPVTGQGTRGPFPADHMFFRSDPDGRLTLVADSYRVLQELYGSDHHARILRLRLQDSRPE